MIRIRSALILSFLFVMISGLVPCSAAQPQRVAILPVNFRSIQSDETVGKVIEKALADKFHTPLAGIVPVYDIIAPGEIAPTLPVAPFGGRQKIKLDKAAIAIIAEKLNADIVIAAEVSQYHTYTYFTGEGDLIRWITFEIRLLCYHKPSGEFIDKKDHKYHHGDDTPVVQPDYIARQLTAALLAKVPDYRESTAKKQ